MAREGPLGFKVVGRNLGIMLLIPRQGGTMGMRWHQALETSSGPGTAMSGAKSLAG